MDRARQGLAAGRILLTNNNEEEGCREGNEKCVINHSSKNKRDAISANGRWVLPIASRLNAMPAADLLSPHAGLLGCFPFGTSKTGKQWGCASKSEG